VGVFEDGQAPLPGLGPKESVRRVQKAVQVQKAGEAQPEGEEEGPLEARRQGQEGGQGQNPPQEVAHQGEEPRPPPQLLWGEDPPQGEGGEEG